ncbi:NTP transferase domain-containing protein [Streptomyces sp. DHE17-7]|nr:NTP transferase domain-containing protein [Streptomyces sp. DHE17-7]MBJ6622073.1 NTP transferase domain-containing protein [Streptomyces sp. DHE17-7]
MTQTKEQVAGLLLAAGGGRRLGGRPKALLEHRGHPLVAHALDALRAAGCTRMHVVLGARAAAVRERMALDGILDGHEGCVLVENPDWERGMGSSLRAGLDSLAATEPGRGFSLGTAGIARAGDERVAQTGFGARTSLVSATYAGVRGHPVLLGADHWAGVMATATGDRGARAYLRDTSGIASCEVRGRGLP